jgi:glycosyltransferase involved in cell wall biosynthesis
MNITMLVLNAFTNDARVHKEASTLSAAGHNVLVVALWELGLAQIENQSGYRIHRIVLKSRSWKNKLLSPPIKYLEYIWRVWRLSVRDPAQIYHANDANTLPVTWIVAHLHHSKIVYDAHELETGRNFGSSKLSWIYRSIWAWPEKLFIRTVQAVITANSSIANELTRLYHIPLPTIVMNCPPRIKMNSTTRLRDELNIPDGLYICLYQGLISPGRGIELFFDAIQLIPNTVGVALGYGPLVETYRQYVKMGRWKRVYLPGKVSLEELPAYTSSADLGIVLIENNALSYYYSLPNKLFEYIHAHIPMIGSNLPEIARIIHNTKTGIVINNLEPRSIADAINRLITDSELYNQCKTNAIHASYIYNWQNEGQKVLDVYDSLQ